MKEADFHVQTGRTQVITELARRIELDIHKRRLKPGDAYLGTAETARMLSVSTTAANRALQLLAKRRVIERKQRKGTLIAAPVDDAAPLQRIHLLVREDYLRKEGLLNDGVVIGLQQQFPGCDMQYNFIRAYDGDEQVRSLLNEALASPVREGFLLVRSTLGMQRMLAASGLPTVVLGSLQPSVTQLPWIDRDHRRAGRLMVEHVLERGCTHLLMLQRDTVLPGDFELYDGVVEAMHAAGLSARDLIVRNLPADQQAIEAEVTRALSRQDGRPGIIARSRPLADGAVSALKVMRRRLGRDSMVAAADIHLRPGDEAPAYPYTRLAIDAETLGRRIGRMFAQQAAGEPVVPPHEIVDVELVLAGRAG